MKGVMSRPVRGRRKKMMLRRMRDTGKKIKDTRPTKLRKSFGRERKKVYPVK